MDTQDQRLFERGFPCHHVGAETQRERDTGQAPPINRLGVWWARRRLTASRAAIVASLADSDTHPATFVRQLGIECVQALVQGEPWTLDAALMARVKRCNACWSACGMWRDGILPAPAGQDALGMRTNIDHKHDLSIEVNPVPQPISRRQIVLPNAR